MLEQGFQLVQRFHCQGFGGLAAGARIRPQGEQAIAQRRVQMTGQLQQIGAFLFATLSRCAACSTAGCRRGSATLRVVDHAHAQNLAEVPGRPVGPRRPVPSGKAASYVRRCFPAGGGVRGAQDVFQAFGFAEEFEAGCSAVRGTWRGAPLPVKRACKPRRGGAEGPWIKYPWRRQGFPPGAPRASVERVMRVQRQRLRRIGTMAGRSLRWRTPAPAVPAIPRSRVPRG